MTFNILLKDLSGRGIKTVWTFNTLAERDAKVREWLTQDGATEEEAEELECHLELGNAVEFEATEYQYL
jgi:hypothetical protein